MPIYEYSCAKCGKTTEAMQKISDPPLKKCPKCGGELVKMISNSSFILKGTGWYVTDFRNGGGSASSASTGAAAAAATAGASTAAATDGAAGSTPCGAACACH